MKVDFLLTVCAMLHSTFAYWHSSCSVLKPHQVWCLDHPCLRFLFFVETLTAGQAWKCVQQVMITRDAVMTVVNKLDEQEFVIDIDC